MGITALSLATRILILGAGREGISNYRFVRARYPNLPITIADESSAENLNTDFVAQLQNDLNATLITGPKAFDITPQFDIALKSPGIPPHLEPLRVAQKRGTRFITNMQLFFELVPHKQTIGVTGTKGKSTTTALIHHVLSQHLSDVRLLGNIGLPPLTVLESTPITSQTYFVIEMSSYQLHEFPYSPHIAVLQNIVPEHLTWHGSFEAYVDAKANITRHQSNNDLFLYNSDGEFPTKIANQSQAQKIGFGIRDGRCARQEQQLVFDDQILLSIDDVPLRGEFNLYNVMPALVIGKHFEMTTEQIAAAVRTFQPLAHRLEYVTTINGVEYYDDSLATVPEATVAALEGFRGRSIVLIAGGYDRGVDYTPLARGILNANIRCLILFPTTGNRIETAIHSLSHTKTPPIYHVDNMPDAVNLAARLSQSGDVVLMSPASASFNLFRDYADRSQQYKAAIAALQ